MKCEDNYPARNERDKRPYRYGRHQLMPNMGVESRGVRPYAHSYMRDRPLGVLARPKPLFLFFSAVS